MSTPDDIEADAAESVRDERLRAACDGPLSRLSNRQIADIALDLAAGNVDFRADLAERIGSTSWTWRYPATVRTHVVEDRAGFAEWLLHGSYLPELAEYLDVNTGADLE
jgi:hypothetical protein